jgi:thiaminase/transcriptional activator TenA
MGFCADQLARLDKLWELMLRHPFLLETRDGTISDARFARWMQQDYLFVEAAVPFLTTLLHHAPPEHETPHREAIEALHEELDLFRERARTTGVELDVAEPAFICHAYIQFLLATAHARPYAEAYTVLYVAEKAYHESWRVVQAKIDPGSRWLPFVENWAGEAFASYVAYLEQELDRLASSASAEEQARMADLFELTVRYEIAFWELAMTGMEWPGLGESESVDPVTRGV